MIYDRVGDADQNITEKTARIAEMVSRKSLDYREQQILPYANETHLKMELMDRVRKMVKGRDKDHPWKDMDDMEIFRSAGLYVENVATGERGFNLAAVLLFGKPEVIRSCVPGYKTDAIYRVENLDRYDDRNIVEDNLIEAYDKLMAFCLKHMDNRFVLDGDISVDARELIAREVVGNILIHRDYTNAFPAKLIIEREQLRTENWSKSRFNGRLSLDAFSPYPKNPLLASFFVNIGRADTLGSGMRNLYKYTKLYSNAEPILSEGDIFEICIPLKKSVVGTEKSVVGTEKSVVGTEKSVVGTEKSVVGTEKSVVGTEKSVVGTEKSVVGTEKSVVQKRKITLDCLLGECENHSYNAIVVNNMKNVYAKIDTDQVFGVSDIESIMGCARSTAIALMKRLKDMELVVAVQGKGKGKYRLKYEAEVEL